MVAETKEDESPLLKIVPINFTERNPILDLLVDRAIEWKKNSQVSMGLSPNVFKYRDKTFEYFTKKNTYLAGIVFNGNLSGYLQIHHIDHETKSAIVDLVIGNPKLWGKGIAPKATAQALAMFNETNPTNKGFTVYAFVKKKNSRSVHTLIKQKFIECSSQDTLPPGYLIKAEDRLFRKQI